MRKILITIALIASVVSASFAQIPIRVGLYVIRSSDTIYLRPNMYRDAAYVYNEIKSTKPLWLRIDSVLRVDGCSMWWNGTTGATPTSGAGTRLMWIPNKSSLIGGVASGNQFDAANIGTNILSIGTNNIGLGVSSSYFGNGNVGTADVQYSLTTGYRNIWQSSKSLNSSILSGTQDTINGSEYSYMSGYGNYSSAQYSFVHSEGSRLVSGTSSVILGGSKNRNFGAQNGVVLGGHALYQVGADSNSVLMNREIIRHGWGKDLTQWQLRSGTILSRIDTSGRAMINKALYVSHDSSSTNSSKTLLSLNVTTSGTAAAGLGGGFMWNIEKNTGTVVNSGRIRTFNLHANGGSAMSFWTNTGSTSTLTEAMRIDTSQIVMINLTAPLTTALWKLQVGSGIYSNAGITAAGSITGTTSVLSPLFTTVGNTDLKISTKINSRALNLLFCSNNGGTTKASMTNNGQWKFMTTAAADSIEVLNVNGGYRMSGREINIPTGTNASPTLIAVTGITSVSTFTVVRIEGNGGAIDITANPQIVDGYDGQVIEIWGEDDVNTVKFDDSNGLQLSGGTSFTMGLGDVLRLRYFADVDLWREVSRSDN